MKTRHSVEFELPLGVAYDLCRQVEDLPHLLPAVMEVTPEEPNGIRFRIEVGTQSDCLRFDAELTEATLDQRLAWRHLSGSIEASVNEFRRLDAWTTQLDVVVVHRAGETNAGLEPQLRQVAADFLELPRFLTILAAKRRGEINAEAQAS